MCSCFQIENITSLPVLASLSQQQRYLVYLNVVQKVQISTEKLLAQPAMDKYLRDSTYNQLLLANVPTLWLHTPVVATLHISTAHTYIQMWWTNVYGMHLNAGQTYLLWANIWAKKRAYTLFAYT